MLEPVRVIIVGKAGAGKTVVIRDFPKPHYVHDTDNKLYTLKYLLKDQVSLKQIDSYNDFDFENLTDIQFVRAKSREFDATYRDLKSVLLNPPMAPDGTPGTFTQDSLTSLADAAINYGLSTRAETGKSMGVIPIPDLPEWLGESMFLSSLFTDLKDLPCNVIVTAHMVITEREVMASKAERKSGISGGTKVTKQLMTGGTKIGAKIPVYFSEVWSAQAIPSVYSGQPPQRIISTVMNDECDLVRTKLSLPPIIDVTYDPNVVKNPSLWEIVDAARRESESV